MLCHYRRDKVPQKYCPLLRRLHPRHDRGYEFGNAPVDKPAGSHQITIEKDALFQVDGVPADLQAVIKKGGDLVVYPKRDGPSLPSLRSI